MNRIEKFGRGGEARLRYLDGDFQVLSPGGVVRCAVTGARYRSTSSNIGASRQEAYADAATSLKRYQETRRM